MRVADILSCTIRDERELVRFVVSTTTVALAVALAADVTNQLVFFVDWTTCLRSWAITAGIVTAIAVPISRLIAKAHLELYRAKMRADELGRTDPLTGMLNRRAMVEAAQDGMPGLLALVIFDLDRFKRVNDTYGHLAGDAVIHAIGQMMVAELAPLGPVARVGGEEFALLAASVTLDALASRLTEFCQRVSSTPIVVGGMSLRMTISAGVALREPGRSFEDLYSEADRALYAAKLAGRNCVRFPQALDALAQKTSAQRPEPLPRSA
jgi:diguanylate cyclase (GGDEF)-like protein